ncbi:MAG: OmpH family outer membrane protein [Alphaproteobacteria bacterium]|nr:OmpH family outer membrane protein [Alphaproteobacteria bacterium]
MAQTKELNPALKKYSKMGIIAAAVIVVAILGIWGISAMKRGVDTQTALKEVTENAVTGADLRIAVVSMDKIQTEATVLEDLHKQRANLENKLKSKLEKEQKAIEKEKADIEKSQDMLSQDALQRRVVEYQKRVNQFQRDLSENAQAIESAYQEALSTVQKKHLDPIIEGIIAKKKLDLVIDGRMARTGTNINGLDITDEVVKALNKKISSVKMSTPKGL